MTLEVRGHSDPPASPSSGLFYRTECVSKGKKKFSLKLLILYTESLSKTEQILIKELGLKMDW